MQSYMDRDRHHAGVQRALELGRAADPAGLPELLRLLQQPSSEIRRLAASAIGKLAPFGANAAEAVPALLKVAREDPHPQAQQYALKALKAFGPAAYACLDDLRDLAADPRAKTYVQVAALAAVREIEQAHQAATEAAGCRCERCGRPAASDEHERSQRAFQRTYCDKCFDEVFLQRRNWETRVELNKTIQAANGTVVQSDGERIVADELTAMGVVFRYDNRFRIVKGYAIRPDFYLPEFDVYVEYWGMEDNLDYRIGMMEKAKLYQQAGKRLVSLYAREKPRLREALREKLGKYARLPLAAADAKQDIRETKSAAV